MKVYVSGALAAASNLQEAVSFYEHVGAILEEAGHSPYLPHRHNHPSQVEGRDDVSVYKSDTSALLEADLCLARLDEPSLGVGAEIAIALQQKVPVLAYYRSGAKISRFATGLIRESGEPSGVLSYSDFADLKSKLVSYLSSRLVNASK